MISEDISIEIKKEFKKLIKDIKKRYNNFGLKDTGEFEKALGYRNKIEDNFQSHVIEGAYYSKWIDETRPPMTYDGDSENSGVGFIEALTGWGQRKLGLEEKEAKSFAYALRKTYEKQGLKIPNQYNAGHVYSKVLNDFVDNFERDKIESLRKVVSDRMKKNILTNIK